MVKIRAKLYRISLVRWVDIPKKSVASLKLPPAESKTEGWKAVLRFNDDIDRVTLLSGKRGCYKLAFKVELLKDAGVDAGDVIEFTLEPDTASREPELPEAMRREFQARPELAATWEKQSLARRRQVIRYIFQAKSLETQTKRSWIFLERMAEIGRLS